jgi:hypothetical protein
MAAGAMVPIAGLPIHLGRKVGRGGHSHFSFAEETDERPSVLEPGRTQTAG